MARPIEYDKQKVLDSITNAFWLKGYEGTSVSELVTETQLNTRTMYNLFNDKTGLFQAALENYHELYLTDILNRIKECNGMHDILEFIKSCEHFPLLNGCLFVNTLSEKNTISQKSLDYVVNFFNEMTTLLRTKLEDASNVAEYHGNPKATADLIVCFLQGYSNFIKLGNDQESHKQMIRQFVACFNKEEVAA